MLRKLQFCRLSSLVLGFSRQESWSGLPCPPPGDLPDPGIKPTSLMSCIGRQVLYYKHHHHTPLQNWTTAHHTNFQQLGNWIASNFSVINSAMTDNPAAQTL